ncbi:MAG: glycosyl transferase family 1 [endosymbiont of Galathealinum brachiosum]|uniref:Glycosyl transferase family 1 n=1 Tax=endosymbiont of Galathealinum brachiosum TaxID=2200906 RepID=A0A370DAB9_9GAMM|nr:MAG: glycosyl transferase family 1 [endosymbiont of Galathealinum brachiosum]
MNILACTSGDCSHNSLRPEHEIYISLAKAGHNVTIITHNNEIYSKRFLDHNINLIEQPIVKKISIKSIRLIRKIIKEQSIDIVYATNSKSIPNTAFACIGLPVKLVVYRGTASGLYWHDPGNYLSVLHPRVDGIICVSKYVYDYVSSLKILKNKSITYIYKGHDINWYDKPSADLAEFGIGRNDFTAICVTNARPHKGIHIALEATNKLADISNFHLLLVGNGMDKEPYKSLINNSKMKQRIHLAGYRNDAPELISASDILIQPSISGEGLPRVVLESMAYGTPVVASANPGSMEIIDDGINGCIVPVGDSDAIAKTVLNLYESPDLLKALSSNSPKVLEDKMSHTRTVEGYIKYFKSLLNH